MLPCRSSPKRCRSRQGHGCAAPLLLMTANACAAACSEGLSEGCLHVAKEALRARQCYRHASKFPDELPPLFGGCSLAIQEAADELHQHVMKMPSADPDGRATRDRTRRKETDGPTQQEGPQSAFNEKLSNNTALTAVLAVDAAVSIVSKKMPFKARSWLRCSSSPKQSRKRAPQAPSVSRAGRQTDRNRPHPSVSSSIGIPISS